MSGTTDGSSLLRAALLDGVSLLVCDAAPAPPGAPGVAGDAARPFARAVSATCRELGAVVSAWRPDQPVAVETDLLVVDATAGFALEGSRERRAAAPAGAPREALRACLDGAWQATRAVANAAFIEPGRSGRIVYVAPACPAAPGRADRAGPADRSAVAAYAEAARAGLENLSRTLSIEWARYGVTTATVAPGARTGETEVAALIAYLASPAGAYFSGCALDLRGLAVDRA